mgnify:CR=1 FL=1
MMYIVWGNTDVVCVCVFFFKQKTAYEIEYGLVGSEMCIRDSGVNNATGVYNSPAVSSGIYESRSFVRLQDVSLAYRFNQTVLSKLDIEALQVYIASKNPYVWTKWSGWDPETGTSNSPLMRNITAGFRVTF